MDVLAFAAVLIVAASPALAAGCPPEGGVAYGQIEAMNQQVIDGDFSGFAASIKSNVGNEISAGIASIERLFPDGFDDCATIAQRIDTGGMVQNVVMFRSKAGPLFAYWLAAGTPGNEAILKFNLNTDIDDVMGMVR